MKKRANSPIRPLDPEELKDITDFLTARLKVVPPQIDFDVPKELNDATQRAEAKKTKRKPKRKAIDLEEKALESRKKNVDIDLVLAQTAELRKPWWKRETVALLALIASLVGSHASSAKPAELPAIVITVQQGQKDLHTPPPYLNIRPPQNPPVNVRVPTLVITAPPVVNDPGNSPLYLYSRPVPHSLSLRSEIENVLRQGSESLKNNESPELVRARIISGLEDLKNRQTAKVSEMRSPALLFSRALENQDLRDLDQLLEFFKAVEFEQRV